MALWDSVKRYHLICYVNDQRHIRYLTEDTLLVTIYGINSFRRFADTRIAVVTDTDTNSHYVVDIMKLWDVLDTHKRTADVSTVQLDADTFTQFSTIDQAIMAAVLLYPY